VSEREREKSEAIRYMKLLTSLLVLFPMDRRERERERNSINKRSRIAESKKTLMSRVQ
jgi:hypothetical protein